jgi:hypothetical protein
VWEKVGRDWKLAADIWNDGKKMATSACMSALVQ